LTLKCATVTLPGTSTEAFPVNVAGFVRNFRGRKMYTRSFQATFFEDSLMRSHNSIRSWLEFVVGTNSGTSGDYIAGYSVPCTLATWDTTGANIDVCTFYNCFPFELMDTTLNSEATQAMTSTAGFHFDFCQFNNVGIR
jgi:hypothetical protein